MQDSTSESDQVQVRAGIQVVLGPAGWHFTSLDPLLRTLVRHMKLPERDCTLRVFYAASDHELDGSKKYGAGALIEVPPIDPLAWMASGMRDGVTVYWLFEGHDALPCRDEFLDYVNSGPCDRFGDSVFRQNTVRLLDGTTMREFLEGHHA